MFVYSLPSPAPSWISLTTCHIMRQIFDLSIQRYESIQTTYPETMPSKSQEEGSDGEEASDSLPLGLIAYRFLDFEANARAFCVQTHADASRKVCSLSEPHPRCSADIL
jgi:hypothetical protein